MGLRLPAGPFVSTPVPAAAEILLEEKKHGRQRGGMPSEAQVPCSKENESTLRGVAGSVGFLGLSGSVPRGSRRAYAQSRQRTSTSARTSSRRCSFPAPRATSSRKRTGRTRATALHPHAVAGGVGFLGLSGSVPRGSRRAYVQSRQRTHTSARNQFAPVLVPGATCRII